MNGVTAVWLVGTAEYCFALRTITETFVRTQDTKIPFSGISNIKVQ
jgi:hypothetical protein